MATKLRVRAVVRGEPEVVELVITAKNMDAAYRKAIIELNKKYGSANWKWEGQ